MGNSDHDTLYTYIASRMIRGVVYTKGRLIQEVIYEFNSSWKRLFRNLNRLERCRASLSVISCTSMSVSVNECNGISITVGS